MAYSENYFDQIDTPFSIWQRKTNHPMNMHTNHYHDAYEIYYLLHGERFYFIKDRTYHVVAGDLVFIKMNNIHKTMDASSPVHERILINFKKNFIQNMLKDFNDLDLFSCFEYDFHVVRLHASEQNHVENLFSKMLSEDKKKAYGANTCIKLALCELLLFLNRYLKQNPLNPFDYLTPLHKKVSEIVVYINCNYMNSITLNHLASHFYISSYYLSRVFKEITGFTFIEYLNSIRVKEAQKLLRESCLNITEIAEKVGYESITHFGRVFKDITGISPLKYRKNL